MQGNCRRMEKPHPSCPKGAAHPDPERCRACHMLKRLETAPKKRTARITDLWER